MKCEGFWRGSMASKAHKLLKGQAKRLLEKQGFSSYMTGGGEELGRKRKG